MSAATTVSGEFCFDGSWIGGRNVGTFMGEIFPNSIRGSNATASGERDFPNNDLPLPKGVAGIGTGMPIAEPPSINECFPRAPRALPRSAMLLSDPVFLSMLKPEADIDIWFLAARTSVGFISDIDFRRSNLFFVRRADAIFDSSSESSIDLECRKLRTFEDAEGIRSDCVPSNDPLLPLVDSPAKAASAAAPSPGAHELAKGEMFAARRPTSASSVVSAMIASLSPFSS